MTANTRNFLVGSTVLVALGIFGWMFLRFGEKSVSLFAPPQIVIHIDAPRVDGLSEGSPLTYQGVIVGRILTLDRNASGNGVSITALLDTKPPVPTNVDAKIVTTNLIGGGTSIALELKTDSATHQPESPILAEPPGTYPTLSAAWVGLSLNILPTGTGETMEQISRLAASIADMGQEAKKRDLVLHLDQAVQNITAQSTRAGKVLQSMEDILGDVGVQRDLRETIANARKASDELATFSASLPRLSDQASTVLTDTHNTLQSTQKRLDEISKQLGASLTQMSALLDSAHAISDKINKGQGTAGLLVNDPKLYQGLVDSQRELNANLKDLQRLIEQWEQEGVSLKGLP